MPDLELIDNIDQKSRGRYFRGQGGGGRGNKNEDLIFDVEDGDGLSVPSDVVSDGYVGSLEQELEARLVRRRWRRAAFLGSLVTAFAVGALARWNRSGGASSSAGAGAAAGSSKNRHTPKPTPKSASHPEKKPAPSPTPEPTSGYWQATLWPTSTVPGPFAVCPPPPPPRSSHRDQAQAPSVPHW